MHEVAAHAATKKLNPEPLAMRAGRDRVGGIPRRRLGPSRPGRVLTHPVLPVLRRPSGGDEFDVPPSSNWHGGTPQSDPDRHALTGATE